MRDMYLTRKLEQAAAEAAAQAAQRRAEEGGDDGGGGGSPRSRMGLGRPSLNPTFASPYGMGMGGMTAEPSLVGGVDPFDDSDLEEVEFLLESYFMLVDSTYNKVGGY